MATFAGARLSADDITALHSRYHDAMHGTFAPDRHNNLPRPLHSCISNRSSNISVLSTKPAPHRTLPSSSLPFRTSQWNEFSDCVRELSPLAVGHDSAAAGDSGSDEVSRTPPGNQRGRRGEGRNTSQKNWNASAEHDVVERLAELSQSPNVDCVAVASALREAEDLLQHPMCASVAPGAPQEKQHVFVSGSEQDQKQRRHIHDGAAVRGKGSCGTHPTGRVAHIWEGEESHHTYQLQHQQHHEEPRQRGDPARQTRTLPDYAEDRDAPSAGAAHQPWTWPTHTTAAAATASFSPSPPLHHPHLHSNPLPGFAPGNPSVPLPQAGGGGEGVQDAAVHWYEVYYAWLLYYQQLYATQILRSGQHERRNQRREARRQRSQQRRDHSDGWAAHPSISQVMEVDDGVRNCSSESFTEDRRPAPAGLHDADGDHHHYLYHRQHDMKRLKLPRSYHRRRFPLNDSADGVAAADDDGDDANDAGSAVARQLRAQVQHLEEKVAALSALVTDGAGEASLRGHGKAAPRRVAERNRGHVAAGDNSRARSGEDSRDSFIVSTHAAAAQQRPISPSTAGTWQDLAERQRSRSGANTGRRPRASPQRPQWR